MSKRRVVVLGGGCGGIAAAWELSRTAELRERFEVTVVQPGFRLGGKGATGRDATRGDAVLEHGLHMWLGFYDEAFAMIRDIYDAWERPATGPQRSLDAAFTPLSHVALFGGSDDAPEIWRMQFPLTSARPWDAPRESSWSWATLAATWAKRMPEALGAVEGPGSLASRARLLAGLGAAISRGLIVELARHGRGVWDELDKLDLRAWLCRHGASAEQADAPPIRALYDLGFAYPDGHARAGAGEAAAGVALRVLLGIFAGYRGAPFFRMNAGMGDTVFSPAFEVLEARGVRFRFFHRLERLRVEGPRIAAIELGVQARDPDSYRPLIQVGPVRAWPDRPLGRQLDAIAEGDLEADTGETLGTRLLREREHFDEVVLAIPSTAHHRFAGELIAANPRYRAMVEHTRGVATIAAQWWLARKTSQLGWHGPPALLTGMAGLFRTWADLTAVGDAEAWDERPASLAYFCNVAPPELQQETDRARAARWVADAMKTWAAGPLERVWPACTHDGRFDEGALVHLPGRTAWDTQYARANVADWERYILSIPGTMHARLAPDESGFDNLVLAGDWTRNKINGGSVEGAVSSGIAAARAIVSRS